MRNINTSRRRWDISLMRWPCPEWFHIPTYTEIQNLHSIMSSLWHSSWMSYRDVVKFPVMWYIDYSTANITNRVYNAYYRTSCQSTNLMEYSATLMIDARNATASPNVSRQKWYWHPIRPFKDKYVEPDNTWTVLAWTLWWGWIFWNEALWLMSATNWTNRYVTLSDKNLWATQVYVARDWMTADNMWNYYQRWNDYWFSPMNSPTKTSTTKVDASTYWPKNHYSSDTFITSQEWDESQNWNLWWYEYYVNKILI